MSRDRSVGHDGQTDDGVIAQSCNGFQGQVAGSLNDPFVVPFEQDRADETDDGRLVGEDADSISASLDLSVEALDGVGRVQLCPVRGGEGHVGQYIGLGLVEQGGELGKLWSKLIGDFAPLLPGGLGVVRAKAALMKAETTRRPLLPAWAMTPAFAVAGYCA